VTNTLTFCQQGHYAITLIDNQIMFVILSRKINMFLVIKSFIYPTDAQLNCSKNINIYIKIYMRGAATCFGFSQPSSGVTVCALLKL
jgi:hypothetical protein